MRYRLREIAEDSKFSRELKVEAIRRAVPEKKVEAALAAEGVETIRERKLNLLVVVMLIIVMNLYTHVSIGGVMKKLGRGLRYVWPNPDYRLPGASAIVYRRKQLGARPMVHLFHQVCQPLAQANTPGAFLFGLRLMGIDGSVEDVPDTPENAKVFGRHHSDRGQSALPQVQGVYLVECGTHAIVDAGFWPYHTSERGGGYRLLRSVEPGMLVMWDRGLHLFDMVAGVVQRGGHVLSRLPAHIKPEWVRTLADGSYLAYLYPSDYKRRQAGERILVRVMAYTLTDPALPGYNEPHRLITTLLDPEAYPLLGLICGYHQRWEAEITFDEIDTHQRLLDRPLRSRSPVGVIQELYGLLIAHYVVRTLIHDAALQADLDPDQLSFVNAVQVICDAIPEFQMTAPEQLPQLYARLLRDIAAERLPQRRLRSNPRVVKRKMSNFRLKRPEHQPWPQPAASFRQAVSPLPGPPNPPELLLTLPATPSVSTIECSLI
jgi:hypothetical protein